MMTRLRRLVWLALHLVLLSGCQTQLHHYTDPAYKVSVIYPGNVSLISDKAILEEFAQESQTDAVDRPELLFVAATAGESRLSCSVHRLPDGVSMTADEYYQASTAQELAQLGGNIVEEKADITINGRVFQRVGFLVKIDEATELHARIYQHLDSKSGRILVLTSMIESSVWESELAVVDPVVKSLKLDW